MGIDQTIYKLIEVALKFTVEQVSTGSSLLITQPLQGTPRDMINKIYRARKNIYFANRLFKVHVLAIWLVGSQYTPYS